jgi:hypothetical protein
MVGRACMQEYIRILSQGLKKRLRWGPVADRAKQLLNQIHNYSNTRGSCNCCNGTCTHNSNTTNEHVKGCSRVVGSERAWRKTRITSTAIRKSRKSLRRIFLSKKRTSSTEFELTFDKRSTEKRSAIKRRGSRSNSRWTNSSNRGRGWCTNTPSILCQLLDNSVTLRRLKVTNGVDCPRRSPSVTVAWLVT